MGDQRGPALAGGVSVVLLDSAQGQPIQTWRFASPAEISIGRDEASDIVISDPHVSRQHVRLVAADGGWTLISQGRHGTLVDDRLVAEREIHSGTVFRLGPSGPRLRFDVGKTTVSISQTMDQFDPDLLAHLNLDEERVNQEVDQIAGGELFDVLLEETRRLRARKDGNGAD